MDSEYGLIFESIPKRSLFLTIFLKAVSLLDVFVELDSILILFFVSSFYLKKFFFFLSFFPSPVVE